MRDVCDVGELNVMLLGRVAFKCFKYLYVVVQTENTH